MRVVETNGLTKIYITSFGKKKVQALIDLDLKVEKGMIFGLLGPNGAGKTTLIKLLLRITFPTAGKAKILNEDISNYKVKSQIGYLPENHKYPSYLKGEEVMHFFGKLSGLDGIELRKKTDELLETVKLLEWKRTKVKAYSKGMMQRLGLAQALLNNPELLFLDEPTDGIDPIGRKEIRNVLLELKERGKTIFLNSHLLSEVELITDQVAILNKGKLIREGTVKELTEKREEYRINIEEKGIDNLLKNLDNISFIKIKDGEYSAKVSDVNELNKMIDILRNRGIIIREIVQQKNTLEDMFVSLITESEKGDSK